MKLTVISGTDHGAIDAVMSATLAQHRDELGAWDVERFDLAEPEGPEGALGALNAPTLFGGPRLLAVDNLEAAGLAFVNQMAANPDTDAVVIMRHHGKILAKVRKALDGIGAEHIERAMPRTARDLATTLKAEAGALGVTLSGPIAQALAERCLAEPARARSVIAALAQVGLTNPKAHQVEMLTGSARSATPPWEVTDAIEKGNGPLAAAKAIEAGNPFALAGWLRTRVTQIARAVEAGAVNAPAVVTELGVTDRQANSIAAAARRMTPAQAAAAAATITRAELGLRSAARPEAVLARAASELARLFGH